MPLIKLTEKGKKFRLDTGLSEGIQRPAKMYFITQPPILGYPTVHGPFILNTNASSEGLAAVLSQMHKCQGHIVAYVSKTLIKSQGRYCIIYKEFLGLVLFVKYFRYCLWDAVLLLEQFIML